jgi:fibronectin-binding autotransporter adhesin
VNVEANLQLNTNTEFISIPTSHRVSGAISGLGQLIQAGTGTLVLSGTNLYSGQTHLIGGGTLKAGSTTGFSPNSAFTVNTTLDLGGFSNSIGSLAGGGIVTNSGTLSPAILTVGADGTGTTFSGDLKDGASTLGLTKSGAGVMLLNGLSTYSGATLVSGGTLKAGSSSGFSPNSAFTVNSTLDLGGFSNTIGSLAGSGLLINSGAGLAKLTTGGDNTDTTFSGRLIDSGGPIGLTRTGLGIMT